MHKLSVKCSPLGRRTTATRTFLPISQITASIRIFLTNESYNTFIFKPISRQFKPSFFLNFTDNTLFRAFPTFKLPTNSNPLIVIIITISGLELVGSLKVGKARKSVLSVKFRKKLGLNCLLMGLNIKVL